MPTVESTLYYAKWCGHCIDFEPKWDAFTSKVESNNEKLNGIKIVTKKYEDGSLGSTDAIINGKPIRGYPTVKIRVVNDNGDAVEYEYNGKRTSEALIDHITNHAVGNLNNNE